MKDFITEYPFIINITLIIESFNPRINIKYNDGYENCFRISHSILDDDDAIEKAIDKEVKTHFMYQRKNKLERILNI